ncbi:glucose-6-phosphate isomerase family protein [Sporolactobacillus sp. KGMB 08714]|uniref:glucose-6-phosphate isomerase family protein n=1 Tax=Sporolactobacillus sp. KGMB 08714 TaxID=3064704 RepID=UPI002FBF1A64
MDYNPGFDITVDDRNMTFKYGRNTFGPEPEYRRLKDIRKSLMDPAAKGPDVLYSIAMDVGRSKDRDDLKRRMLLYGAVIYAKGKIGREPVRSQGHIHAISPSSDSSTPEVYEIWDGEAIVYMQETAHDDPGRCFAVHAKRGDIVIVPPAWAHCTINADIHHTMTFGAWCIRDYSFDYKEIRAHKGLAFYPIVGHADQITWQRNDHYRKSGLQEQGPRSCRDFNLQKGVPVYKQYVDNRNLFDFVTEPMNHNDLWRNYQP